MRSITIYCFTLFLLLVITNHCTAQKMAQLDSARNGTDPIPQRYQNLGPRDPGTALLLSYLLPGGGQFYNRQYGKGVIVGGLQLGSGGVLYVIMYRTLFSLPFHRDTNVSADQIVGLVTVLLGTTIYSLFDASASANQLNRLYHLNDNNRKHNFISVKFSPTYIVAGNTNISGGSFGLKLTLR